MNTHGDYLNEPEMERVLAADIKHLSIDKRLCAMARSWRGYTTVPRFHVPRKLENAPRQLLFLESLHNKSLKQSAVLHSFSNH